MVGSAHGPTQTDNDSNIWQGYCVTQQSKMTTGKRIRREALGEATGLLDRPVASGSASMTPLHGNVKKQQQEAWAKIRGGHVPVQVVQQMGRRCTATSDDKLATGGLSTTGQMRLRTTLARQWQVVQQA